MTADIASILDIIRQKRARLEALQREADELRAELRQIEDVSKGRPVPPKPRGRPRSRHGFTGGKRSRPIQQGSSVDRALRALRGVGGPLRADDLVELINTDGGDPVKKATLVSNLSRYVKHRDTFTRPGPNTFGLVEFKAQQQDDEPEYLLGPSDEPGDDPGDDEPV